MRAILTITACTAGQLLYGQDSIFQNKNQKDTLAVKWLEEVIVLASRVTEKIMQSPVSVKKSK